MKSTYDKQFNAKIKQINGKLRKSSNGLESFISHFFGKLPAPDIDRLEPEQSAKLAEFSYDLLQNRKPGEPKIEILSPDQTEKKLGKMGTALFLINDDKPFLVDSLTAELVRQGFTIYENVHPILRLTRDAKGKLKSLDYDSDKRASAESLIYFLISPLPEAISPESLKTELEKVLTLISAAVTDWKTMVKEADAVRKHLQKLPSSVSAREKSEIFDFLHWLASSNYVFLGFEEYVIDRQKLKPVKKSALGICRIWEETKIGVEDFGDYKTGRPPIEIVKSSRISRVHRPVPMDLIRVTGFDEKGKATSEFRFYGLFTSIAYYQSADQIPFIRMKISQVMEVAGFDPISHNGKSLRAILEFFPRDELFQISIEEFYSISLGIMSLEARPDVGLFLRQDAYKRFYSCLVFLPRDRFNTFVRKEIAAALEQACGGEVTGFYTQMTESPLARIHLIVSSSGKTSKIDMEALTQKISDIVNYWIDRLRTSLGSHFGNRRGETIYRMFQAAFPKNYINTTEPADAVEDILKITEATEHNLPQSNIFRLENVSASTFHIKIYTLDKQAELSDILPVLENLGCKVVEVDTFAVKPGWSHEKKAIIRNFTLTLKDEAVIKLEEVKANLEEALLKLWSGEMENDGFNTLILRASLNWRQVTLLRLIGKYLKQSSAYSEAYFAQVLASHTQMARLLCRYFEVKFNPIAKENREKELPGIEEQLLAYFDTVTVLSEDMVLRQYLDALRAMLRTNYYQLDKNGNPKPYISVKFDSGMLPFLPLPKPYREIFVYAPSVEGIHLRSGKVARGGLRWSDRHEDFRTEILGLMKAQKVKNAVIVPVGAKGGFIVKRPPLDPNPKIQSEEGIRCYQTFLRGLLDITDNIVSGKVVPPKQVVRHDEDDPYLVVAADKGTASFSDIANGISAEYDFWLGDAFASGGSAGYDHKEMAITARGAWVGVERHFREMGKDISKETFTVIGIGDMAGDVFGNGMLLSENIRLLAAFNHKHIFLDPDPDPAVSFKERKRLFHLPRSQWSDYDERKISSGGGIFERSAKSIKLSVPIKKIIGTDKNQLSPDELIQLLLKAEVDLLWNGGIGTFVKAESESHESVGDRSNNAIRINGNELRAKIAGEGGNLGFTQRGRIEYARAGGRINTDAIDNSAGVDCSDHEVNIKIALSELYRSGKLTKPKRDALLEKMTDEVAALVLRDNRLQTQALSIAEYHGFALLEPLVRTMRGLEDEGLLNRAIEFLPAERDIQQLRAEKRGMTRPELAVLLAYSKMSLYEDILNSSLPDSDYCVEDLLRYFPEPMQAGYRKDILAHPLRREIIATSVTNSTINRAGIAFFHTLQRETGRKGCDVARAYLVTRDAFGLRSLWEEIEALDGKLPASIQMRLFSEIEELMTWATAWFLRHGGEALDIGTLMQEYGKHIAEYAALVPGVLSPSWKEYHQQQTEEFIAAGVPEKLAARIGALDILKSGCDIALIAHRTGTKVARVAELYYAVGSRLNLGALHTAFERMVVESPWDREALQASTNELYEEQQRLTLEVLAALKPRESVEVAAEKWLSDQGQRYIHFTKLVQEILSLRTPQLSMIFIILREIRQLGNTL